MAHNNTIAAAISQEMRIAGLTTDLFELEGHIGPKFSHEKHSLGHLTEFAENRFFCNENKLFSHFLNTLLHYRTINPLTYQADNRPHVKKHADNCLHVNRIYQILPLGLLQSLI